MDDKILTDIYNAAYKQEFNHNYDLLNHLYEGAKDKKYAIKIGFGLASLLHTFNNTGTLDVKITHTYEHMDKLGYSIAQIVRVIPDTVFAFKKEEELRIRQEEKSQTVIIQKRLLGIFPYQTKVVNYKKGRLKIGSSFENLIHLPDIAEAFGKQRAIITLYEKYKLKFIESGGMSELNSEELDQYNLIPARYQTIFNLKMALATNNLDEFFKILQGIFASLSYNIKATEAFFHSHIHIILVLLDFKADSEIETNEGRIDMVCETENFIHIFEFKLTSSKIALQQIIDKKYFQKYRKSNKQLVLTGIALDVKKKNIRDWKSMTCDD